MFTWSRLLDLHDAPFHLKMVDSSMGGADLLIRSDLGVGILLKRTSWMQGIKPATPPITGRPTATHYDAQCCFTSFLVVRKGHFGHFTTGRLSSQSVSIKRVQKETKNLFLLQMVCMDFAYWRFEVRDSLWFPPFYNVFFIVLVTVVNHQNKFSGQPSFIFYGMPVISASHDTVQRSTWTQ